MSHLRPGRPLIVPVFLPFQGCPHRCVYCDQEKITSRRAEPVHPSTVTNLLEQAVRSPSFDSSEKHEVAFYGGTFTRLPRAKIQELLEAVSPFLRDGRFHSIRLSTRPDGLDEETLLLLKQLGVWTVELGAQSMDDDVLRLSQRGHCAGDTIRSVRLLREKGFRVGIQLMPGLPGDSEEKFLATVDRVTALLPDMVRLYPTVVIKGTILADWYLKGIYKPWPLVEALEVCCESVVRLERNAIPVIRIGLMSSPSLREFGQVLGGPWHEAFGHMVRSSVYHRRIEPFLPRLGETGRILLRVHPKEVPLMRGFKNSGIRDVELKTGATVQSVLPDTSISPGCIRVETL
ncbi:MAG: radical SAM protein [Deltaproteobacteria bacterium]|nr:radical SAM protein [Deltaproteobacteria bacterium]